MATLGMDVSGVLQTPDPSPSAVLLPGEKWVTCLSFDGVPCWRFCMATRFTEATWNYLFEKLPASGVCLWPWFCCIL